MVLIRAVLKWQKSFSFGSINWRTLVGCVTHVSASDVCWLFCQKLIWTNPITPFETPRLPSTVPFSNQPKMKRCFDHLYPPLVQIDFAFVGTVECRPDFPNRSALQSTTHSRARIFACLHANMLRLITAGHPCSVWKMLQSHPWMWRVDLRSIISHFDGLHLDCLSDRGYIASSGDDAIQKTSRLVTD